jgi:hypothetical protein
VDEHDACEEEIGHHQQADGGDVVFDECSEHVHAENSKVAEQNQQRTQATSYAELKVEVETRKNYCYAKIYLLILRYFRDEKWHNDVGSCTMDYSLIYFFNYQCGRLTSACEAVKKPRRNEMIGVLCEINQQPAADLRNSQRY